MTQIPYFLASLVGYSHPHSKNVECKTVIVFLPNQTDVLVAQKNSLVEKILLSIHIIHLFVLILYFPVNNFSVMSWQIPIFLGCTSTKRWIKCHPQGHNTVTPPGVSLMLATIWSPALPTEPLCSAYVLVEKKLNFDYILYLEVWISMKISAGRLINTLSYLETLISEFLASLFGCTCSCPRLVHNFSLVWGLIYMSIYTGWTNSSLKSSLLQLTKLCETETVFI